MQRQSQLPHRLTLTWQQLPAAQILLRSEASGEYLIKAEGKIGHVYCRELADVVLLAEKFSP